jgi:hypothetical protein
MFCKYGRVFACRVILFVLILVLPLASVAALSFTWAPLTPLFREGLADPFSDSTAFKYLKVLNDDGVPDSILVADSTTNEYKKYKHDTRALDEYWQMKSAVNIGLLRLSTTYLEIEGYLAGGLNTVFQRKGGIDCLGVDGMYGAGISLRIAHTVVLSAGFHHFSGHWGDEIIANAMEINPTLDFYSSTKNEHLVEYTRGNSWMARISIEPTDLHRLYFIAELPMEKAWIRPGIHVPSYVLKPGSDDVDQFQNMTGQEGLTGLTGYDAAYKAWRLQGGFEIRKPVSTVGLLFFAAEVQAHQDGKTLHQVGGYDARNPWEFEYTIGAGFEFNQGFMDRKFRLEVNYHDGRFPLLNYFFQRSKYITLGLAISG